MLENVTVTLSLQDFYRIREGERYGRQYVTAADIEPYRVRFTGAVLFLDYIHKRGESG